MCSNPRTYLDSAPEQDISYKRQKLSTVSQNDNELSLHKLDSLRELHSYKAETKVDDYLKAYPLNLLFIKREKGRLPYSVFKPHS